MNTSDNAEKERKGCKEGKNVGNEGKKEERLKDDGDIQEMGRRSEIKDELN